MNYSGPIMSLVSPSGMEGDPTLFYMANIDTGPVVQWSYEDETAIRKVQIQVFDGQELIWDSLDQDIPQDAAETVLGSALLHLNSLRHFAIPPHKKLAFDHVYSVRIRGLDTQDDPRWEKWGPWTDPAFFKAVLSPQSAVIPLLSWHVDVYADHKKQTNVLYWSLGDLSGYQVSGYNVKKADNPAGPFTTVNLQLLQDMSYETDQAAYFQIEAVMPDGSTALSPVVSGSIFTNYWLIGSFQFDGPTSFSKKRDRLQSKRTTLKKRRVIQDRGFLPEDISLEIILADDDESSGAEKYRQLLQVLSQTVPLTIRDPFGRSWTIAPGAFEDTPLMSGKEEYRVKFDLSEVGS